MIENVFRPINQLWIRRYEAVNKLQDVSWHQASSPYLKAAQPFHFMQTPRLLPLGNHKISLPCKPLIHHLTPIPLEILPDNLCLILVFEPRDLRLRRIKYHQVSVDSTKEYVEESFYPHESQRRFDNA